jgi:hypothetical protein
MAFRVDLGAFSVSSAPGSEGRYQFAVTLGSGDFVTTAFSFVAERRYTSGNVFETFAQVVHHDGTIIDLDEIPSTYDVTLPIFFPPGSTPIHVVTTAFADGPSNTGAVNVNAYNSAWVGIQGGFTSANGYGYPGVPEPSTVTMMPAGILGIAAVARRRRSGLRFAKPPASA